MSKENIPLEYIICLNCDKKIYFNDWIKAYKQKAGFRFRMNLATLFWSKKKFCDGTCAGKYKQKQHKPCEHCGKKFYRKNYETMPAWKKRKFCSNECLLEYRNILRLSKSMNVEYLILKKELIKIAEKYRK